jgi:hypothetical protein
VRFPFFALFFISFTLLVLFLIFWKVHPYGDSLSSLIGIWDGFAELNPWMTDPGFVIFKEGGYDGQFFYFLAKSLFSDQKWDLIVDSYSFRFHRIGFTLLVGIPSFFFGFTYYPFIALIVSFSLFLVSAICLYHMLPKEKNYLTLFYLFSPYSLNSHLLLVADGVFTSLALISVYLIQRKSNAWLIMLILTLTVFTREFGIFLILPLFVSSILKKDFKMGGLYFVPLLLFSFFLYETRNHMPNHLGTNPLGFKDMLDFPLFGFVKSFFDNGMFHLSGKESIKLLLFAQFILLTSFVAIYFWRYSNLARALLTNQNNMSLYFLPVLAGLGVIFLAEEGYWRSFDNLSRMFTFSVPFLLLINGQKESKILNIFQYSSILLFLFLILRILIITQTKDFYFAP